MKRELKIIGPSGKNYVVRFNLVKCFVADYGQKLVKFYFYDGDIWEFSFHSKFAVDIVVNEVKAGGIDNVNFYW